MPFTMPPNDSLWWYPSDVRCTTETQTFKTLLKSYLFRQAFWRFLELFNFTLLGACVLSFTSNRRPINAQWWWRWWWWWWWWCQWDSSLCWMNESPASEPQQTTVAPWRFGLAVWCSGNALVSINAVALHRAWLVLGWVTAFRQVNYLIT